VRIDGTEVVVEGDGPPVVLLHGWPDTLRVWDPQVNVLRARYRCIRFTWPGFEPGAPRATHTLDELLALLDRVVEQAAGGAPLTLLLHDWGCLFGYQYALRQPQRVARVIGVDVGDAGSRQHLAELGPGAKALTVGYQLWLALAWRAGGGLGDGMARWMARRARAPDAEDTTAAMAWPYDVQWLRGGFKGARLFRPACPMLFIYGSRKPFTFHSRAWASEIAAQPGNAVLALPTGHWVMRQAPSEFNQAMLNWLAGGEVASRDVAAD
jgi:pimeloyl-ACP methyl ester carboxylesterase